jgi:hypothetical protein
VVISSEWDFSPLTYSLNVSVLPNFLLIGMPVPESGNALILPLAGHELGHSVWANDNLESSFAAAVQTKARDYIKANDADFKRAYHEHSALTITDTELSSNMFLVQIVEAIVNLH